MSQLLGYYKSRLTQFHYQQLLSLVEQAVALGEFSGSTNFDTSALQEMQQQAQDFSQLPVDSAGRRLTEDSLNRPLGLLKARYDALASENEDFQARAALLIELLEKDSVLLDQILQAAELEHWADSRPRLREAQTVRWDYGMAYGSVSDLNAVDPRDLQAYPCRPPVTTVVDAVSGEMGAALRAPTQERIVGVKYLNWQEYSSSGQSEELFGTDWARLSLLEPRPRVSFTRQPELQPVMPADSDGSIGLRLRSCFAVEGQVDGGSLPVFVRLSLHERRSSTLISASDQLLAGTSFPVAPGDQIYLEVSYHSSVGATGFICPRLLLLKSDGNPVLNAGGTDMIIGLPAAGPTAADVSSQKISGMVSLPNNPEIATAVFDIAYVTATGVWTVDSQRVHCPISLHTLQLNPDSVWIWSEEKVYFLDQDYRVVSSGRVTLGDIPDGVVLSVRYLEAWPAFSCSVNQNDWSPLVMLDGDRPYPDEEELFPSLTIVAVQDSQGNVELEPDGRRAFQFALTDETGAPTGIYLRMRQRPDAEYIFQVFTPADPLPAGVLSELEIDLERPSYLTGLHLAPFTNFPTRLMWVHTQAFANSSREATSIDPLDIALDRPLQLSFPRRLVRRIYLSLYQENYSLKEYTLDPPDKLRRDTLASLQAVVPFAARRLTRSLPVRHRGALYEFGLEHLYGVDEQPTLPGVFVAGPYRFLGCPEVIRLDAEVEGVPEFYLCWYAYDLGDAIRDLQVQGVRIQPGQALIFPFPDDVPRERVDHADLYLKIVFRTPADQVERFQLQLLKV